MINNLFQIYYIKILLIFELFHYLFENYSKNCSKSFEDINRATKLNKYDFFNYSFILNSIQK